MASSSREQLERWLRQIHVKCDSVLDVGGGQRNVKDRVGSWKVKNYKVLDNEAGFKPDIFADMNCPLIDRFEVGEIKKMKADVVFCLELMEYVFDPLTAHKNIYCLLKRDGIAYISYQSIYPLHNPPGTDCLRYMKPGIEKLLAESGFRTWEITPRVATIGRGVLAQFYSLERMRPMKDEPAIFDTGYLVKCLK